jgi:hypothetical protein
VAYRKSVYPEGLFRLQKAEMGAIPIFFGVAGVLAQIWLSLGTAMVLVFGNSQNVKALGSLS